MLPERYSTGGETAKERDERSLQEYWDFLKRRRWTIALSVIAVVALVMAFTFRQPPMYEATARVLARGPSPDRPGDVLSSALPVVGEFVDERDIGTQVEVLRSFPILKKGAESAGIKVSEGTIVPVKIVREKDTYVVKITGTSGSPVQAARLANGVSRAYIEHDLDQTRRRSIAARQFLGKQLAKYKTAVNVASGALRDYQARAGAVGLDTETSKKVESVSGLEADLVSARNDESAARARALRLRSELKRTSGTIVGTETIERNPEIARLQERLAELSATRAALLRDWTPTSRKVRAVDEEIEGARARQKALVSSVLGTRQVVANPLHQSLMGQLVDAESAAVAASARRSGLVRAIAEQQARLRRLPEQQFRMASLTRSLQSAEKTLEAVQERYEQLRIAEQSSIGNAQIVDPARVPLSPIVPKPKLNFVLALIAGSVLGLALAALREAMDSTLRDAQDVERHLSLPVLGSVGVLPQLNQRALASSNGSNPLAEAFREIRSSIKSSGPTGGVKTLMVSSAVPGDGKSLVAVNLALSLARSGSRVALVDTDLRRPGLHKSFDLDVAPGLSDHMLHGAPLSAVTHDLESPTLSVIPAGSLCTDPADLLDSGEFGALVRALRASYDYVVFDTPPLVGLADAKVIGGLVDGAVLVVAPGTLERPAAQRLIHVLSRAGVNVLGVVLNKVDARGDSAGYYRDHADRRRSGVNASSITDIATLVAPLKRVREDEI